MMLAVMTMKVAVRHEGVTYGLCLHHIVRGSLCVMVAVMTGKGSVQHEDVTDSLSTAR